MTSRQLVSTIILLLAFAQQTIARDPLRVHDSFCYFCCPSTDSLDVNDSPTEASEMSYDVSFVADVEEVIRSSSGSRQEETSSSKSSAELLHNLLSKFITELRSVSSTIIKKY
ncbi:hypothetical protein D917_10658 [Trichinella nativa]|uniref:Uncharacterized protein n=1 Tax=Trichinella nativa TaxID=6335 RepID=A0A1Y3EDC9_9BILA|nr:hypothetical protein D917_10658 [Trichinella nativa]